MRNLAKGMTLIELLTAILILSILTAIAVPSFRDMNANSRVTAATNGLVTALNLARSESLRRAVPATVCSSANGTSCANSTDWSTGWIAFIDTNGDGLLTNADATVDSDGSGALDANDALLQSWPAVGGTIVSRSPTNSRFARYNVMGMMDPGAGVNVNVQFGLPGCSGLKVGQTLISLIGSIQSSKVDCTAASF